MLPWKKLMAVEGNLVDVLHGDTLPQLMEHLVMSMAEPWTPWTAINGNS